MNGTLRSSTGLMAVCDEEGCMEVAGVVVGPRHLCPTHAWEEERDARCRAVRKIADYIATAKKEGVL